MQLSEKFHNITLNSYLFFNQFLLLDKCWSTSRNYYSAGESL